MIIDMYTTYLSYKSGKWQSRWKWGIAPSGNPHRWDYLVNSLEFHKLKKRKS